MDLSPVNTTLGPVTIRPGVPGDAPAYRDLRLEGLRLHPTAFGGDLARSEAMSSAEWEARLAPQEGGCLFFAVDEGGSLVGTAAVRLGSSSKTNHTAEVLGVYVRPPWRGQRLGEILVRACVEWAREWGASNVKLGVESTNQAAIACYQRAGFTGYAIEPQAMRIDGQDYDFLRMWRRLDTDKI